MGKSQQTAGKNVRPDCVCVWALFKQILFVSDRIQPRDAPLSCKPKVLLRRLFGKIASEAQVEAQKAWIFIPCRDNYGKMMLFNAVTFY